MDEASRRLERSSQASGDRFARVRAANDHLRAGRFDVALSTLGEPSESDLSSFEVMTRSVAHLRSGHPLIALEALEWAVARAPGLELEPSAVLEVLAAPLAGKVPLGRARAARVLARVASKAELPLDDLRADADPLVRLAFVKDRPTFTREERVTRVYGSHGADYETGRFLAFDACLEVRVRTFDLRLFGAVATALSTLAEDPHAIETLELHAAFGDGWGLGGNNHVIDEGVYLRAIDSLNRLDLLPWALRDCHVRPYDLMEDEERLIRRLAYDIGGHPVGRQTPFDPSAPLLGRILAKHPFRGPPCSWEELAPLLEEAKRAFSPLGARACEVFARHARARQKL